MRTCVILSPALEFQSETQRNKVTLRNIGFFFFNVLVFREHETFSLALVVM